MTDLKKIAITGANGYLGTHIIKKAIHKGWDVNAIIRREEVKKELETLGANVFIVKNFNLEGFKEAFFDCKAIIHLANVVCGTPTLFESINVEGLKVVLQAAKYSNVSRIIYPSGLGVDKYGVEDWANNEYFRSKREAEKIIMKSDLSYVIFRPSYILGPNDELIPEIIDQIFNGSVMIVGEGNIPFQPIFVGDATEAFLAAAQGLGKDNTVYELVGPEILNMNLLVEMVINVIKERGINIPAPEILHISYEEAPKKLDICEEMVDIMKCDLTPDPKIASHSLGYELSPLKEAVKNAINEKLFSHSLDINKRAIVLLSGGIDSATALFWAINEGYDPIALTINYNWRPEQEINATKKLAGLVDIKLLEINTPFIAQATDLLSEGYPVPVALNAPEGYIPQRNLIFYSIAAYFAEIYGCKWIIGGHILDDVSIFSDTKPSFFKSLEKQIKGSKHEHDLTEIKLLFPLVNMNKVEVIKLAKELKVPLEITWSCYQDIEKPCGKCKSCQKREEAFKALNMN